MLSLYKSSAGSGKTFTLVKEYLKLCLPAPDKYKNIVAITFTNAASAEMKERILYKLKGLAEGAELDLKSILLKEGLTETQIGNAGKVLENILYNYSKFNVSTIDSFFHKILQAFGKELGLPLDFEIFLETDEALDYAVDTFIHRSHTNPEVHKILLEYIRQKIANGNSWIIRPDLYKIAWELLDDATFLMQAVDFDKIKIFISTLRNIISEFETSMDKIGTDAIKILDDYGLDITDFKFGKSGPIAYFYKIVMESKDYEPGKRFISSLSNPVEWLTKTATREAEEALNLYLINFAASAYEKYERCYPEYISAKEVLRNIYTFAVYEEINKTLLEYKEKNEVVLISDFNRILANHLVNEQISFVYSKIGAKYEHFLIDEFQDTSSLQWINLRPLIENAVSQGAECLIVGDSKQAIYRWRGGEVELIENQITEEDFPHNSKKINLAHNYRSKKAVVEFNNNFFENMLRVMPLDYFERELLDQIYGDVRQIPASKDAGGGQVEVTFYEKEGRLRENFLAPAREKLLETIQSVLSEKYSLKDITILVRNKSDAGDIAQLLFSNGIDFVSQDSLFLDKSPAIRLLLSILTYLADTRNVLAKTELLYIYAEYFNDSNTSVDLCNIFNSNIKNDRDVFNKILPKEFTQHIFSLSTKPVYELVEVISSIFGLDKIPDAYLQRFKEVALEFSKQHKRSISFFLEWWKEGKYAVVMPDDLNAIRIMTIHKSKGLEFPVVIMPFADWNFRSGHPDILWISSDEEPFNEFEKLPVTASPKLANSVFSESYQKEEALIGIDNLNLLYVAFTRAKDKLYIITEKIKTDKEEITSVSRLLEKVLQPVMNENCGVVSFDDAN